MTMVKTHFNFQWLIPGSRRLVLALLFFLLSSTVQAQLTGIYTVGGTSPDYATITAAVAALNAQGISDPVEFRIRNGTYNERVTVTNFARSGASDDTVTFRRESALGTVNWQYSSPGNNTNWVLKLDGAEHVIIRGQTITAVDSTYADLIRFEGGAANNLVELCTFNGQQSVGALISQTETGNHPDNRINNNIFNNGEKAISFDYIFGGVGSDGTEITDNEFNWQTLRAVEVRGSNSVVSGNTISDWSGSDPDYNAIVAEDSAAAIENNDIAMTKGSAAIWLFALGGSALEARVVNNLISMHSSNASRGIFIATDNVSVYHNTVRVSNSTAPALYLGSEADIDIRVRNNLLINAAGGLAYRVDAPAGITESNNNNLYSSGTPLVTWDGVDHNSLTDHQLANEADLASVNTSVSFVDAVSPGFDLHLNAPSDSDFLLLAPSLASVTADIDGDVRSEPNAYKGADEGIVIAPLDNADTVSGFYTVGGASPDYATPGDAIRNLKLRGMKGPVTFRVRAGTYNTHEQIRGVVRTGNADDQIVVRASNLINTPVLQHAATNANDNWILKIEDTPHVAIWGLAFTAIGAGSFGRLLVIEGESSDSIDLQRNEFNGLTGQTGNSADLLYSGSFGQNSLSLVKNTFHAGSTAVWLGPDAFGGSHGTGLELNDNSFDAQAVGAVFTRRDDVVMSGNTVSTTAANVVGILLRFNKDILLLGNTMQLTGANATAIQLAGADGRSFADPGLINNNFISADIGIHLSDGSGLIYIDHNSILSAQYPLYIPEPVQTTPSPLNLEVINNIFINTGAGPAMFVARMLENQNGADINVSERNNYSNSSGALVHWEGVNYNSLGLFQASSGTDEFSSSVNVEFVDEANTDLHLAGASLGDENLTAMSLVRVPSDFDGDTRSLTAPYKGADEANIMLDDPNDFAPVITPDQNASVSDAAGNSTPVLIVAATDQDPLTIFENWTIISGNTGGAFAIDADSGEITVAAALDASVLSSYLLTLNVSDGAQVSAPETVSIDVTDASSGVDLMLSISDGISDVITAATITYTVEVSNSGPDAANAADVEVSATTGLTGLTWQCISASAGASCGSSGAGNVTDTINLPAGAGVVYEIGATVSGIVGEVTTLTGSVTPAIGETENNSLDNFVSDHNNIVEPSVEEVFADGFEF